MTEEQLNAISKELGIERRDVIINLAYERYMKTGITNNISEAMEMVNATLPKVLRQPVYIGGKSDLASKPGLIPWLKAQGFSLPPCPDCGSPMDMKALPKGNKEKTQIFCTNCDTAFYSEDDFIKTANKFMPEGTVVRDVTELVERSAKRKQARNTRVGG